MPTDRAIEILEKLVAFDSTSRNSNLPLLDYIQSYLQQEGIASSLVYNEERTKANLLASIGPKCPGGVVLSGHTDVVPVDGQDWETPPFTLTPKGDLLYGRGTADMKSFVAVALAMVPHFTRAPLKRPIHLAFSYDEEVGCLGVHSLIEEIIRQDIAPSLAIIGEPTEMQVVNAHKGIYSFETTVSGLEAHSSAVNKGVNAIMVATELIHFLTELQAEYCNKPASTQALRFEPSYTTLHVGIITGGIARNIIPKKCTFNWEFRIIPGDKPEAILEQFERKVAALLREMQKIHPEASITTTRTSYAPDLRAEENIDAEGMLLQLSHTNDCKAMSFGTEAGIFQKNHISALLCGPGSIMQAHKPNEYIATSQIALCVKFMERLANELCL